MGMILRVCHFWILGLWVVMLAYWGIAALFAKPTLERSGRTGLLMRLAIGAAVAAAVILVRRSPQLLELQLHQLGSLPMALAGAVIATAGAALAFSARAVLGRNWGTPGSRKADAELVTRGPYGLVRHPIYGGILLMMIGTAIGLIASWWAIVAAASAYFIYSARREERLMTERFPELYPAYRARTRMLLPFIV